jgi:hypothetical protein
MESVREAWTDERLDDLTNRVDAGFGRLEREFQALRLEMRTEFVAARSEIGGEFSAVRSEIGGEFSAVRSEMSAMNRTMLQIVLGGYAVMIVGFAGTIATVITQV